MATAEHSIVDSDHLPSDRGEPLEAHHIRNLSSAVHTLIMTLTRGSERESRIIERDARMHASLDRLVENTSEILAELRKRPA